MDELKGKRVFIVEDDPSNMAVFAVTLKQSGALVIQDPWNSGTIDLLLRVLPIDIILLDLMLRRDMSGYDIYTRIREHPALADIPAVIVSASDPEIEIPRAKAMGFAGFIGKPIDVRLFPVQVAACLDGQPVWSGHHYPTGFNIS